MYSSHLVQSLIIEMFWISIDTFDDGFLWPKTRCKNLTLYIN